MDKIKVLAIIGPTGVGKTSLSIRLAQKYDGEIISCDSMQVYKKMDIGTAKITEDEKQGIIHYLIDEQAYDEPYNVMLFQDKCRQKISEIHMKDKLPILCGGTGLYLKAALYDYIFEEQEIDLEYHKALETKSNEELVSILKVVDPEALNKIHPNNRKRLIRALEIAHNGTKKSELEARQDHIPLYDVYFLGLDVDRDILHQRIDDRVDEMFEQGLVKEATTLFKDPNTWEYTSFQGIGYKEFKAYFLNECSLDQVKKNIKTHSRQFAKRQYTWFKNQMDVHWFERDDIDSIDKAIEEWSNE